MLYNRLLFILFLLCTLCLLQTKVQAQKSNTYELIGTMIPEGMRPMTYKVVFEVQNNLIRGYTLSDIGGQYETKARIKGTFNPINRQIQFSESEIIYTNYKKSNQNLCMPSISGKLNVKQGKT
ncbi:MAG: hypothetical protein FGM54_09410, partial [Chitinophagaceae bacterium]|nr:hypothetical protein [Chitinophagaceae bacterium]